MADYSLLGESWVWAILLGAIVVPVVIGFLLPKDSANAGLSRKQTNVALFKEKQAELLQSLEQGKISKAEQQQLQQELEGQLLDDAADQRVSQSQSPWGKWLLVVCLLSMPVFVLGIYQEMGAYDGVKLQQELERMATIEDSEQLFEAGQEVMVLLQNWVEKNPEDYPSHNLLAKAAMSGGDYVKASEHFAKVYEGYPEDADVIAQYAQSLYLARQRQMDATVKDLLAEALSKNPSQPVVLGLLGIDAFAKSGYVEAAHYWEKALFVMAEGAGAGQTLQQGLLASYDKLKQAELPEGVLPLTVSIPQEHIRHSREVVWISLREVGADGKALAGPPLAVKKLRAGWLPQTVWFSSYDRVLSGNDQQRLNVSAVQITGRLSREGGPLAKAGDIQSLPTIVTLAELTGPIDISLTEEVQPR